MNTKRISLAVLTVTNNRRSQFAMLASPLEKGVCDETVAGREFPADRFDSLAVFRRFGQFFQSCIFRQDRFVTDPSQPAQQSKIDRQQYD